MKPELQLANRMQALTRLQPGLSHDLKSPLNAIVLNLELLKRSLQAPSENPAGMGERQQRWIGLVERELRRLQEGLELVMAQLGPTGEKAATFDLGQLLREIETLLHAQARQQRVELRCSAPHDFSMPARRDALRESLLAVGADLLLRLEEGGELSLELETRDQQALLRLRGTPSRGTLGVPPDPETTNAAGLPLAAARAIAAEHGGSAELTDVPGDAVTFELTLPLHPSGS